MRYTQYLSSCLRLSISLIVLSDFPATSLAFPMRSSMNFHLNSVFSSSVNSSSSSNVALMRLYELSIFLVCFTLSASLALFLSSFCLSFLCTFNASFAPIAAISLICSCVSTYIVAF